MPLLNYYDPVSEYKSIAAIQMALARAGASDYTHTYDRKGYIIALGFRMKLGRRKISFLLPVNWRSVQKQLEAQDVEGRYRTQVQALRIAWRIRKDWVDAQLAIIETRTATAAQVFLPYSIAANGQTLYEYLAQNTQLLLEDENN